MLSTRGGAFWPIDKGRFDVTKDPDDLYVFRVASLRNVAMTPYFYNGSVATLPEAVKVMARVRGSVQRLFALGHRLTRS